MKMLFLSLTALFVFGQIHLRAEVATIYAETFKYLGEENTGSSTNGRLVQAADGNFYGTTPAGGNQLGGVIFQLNPSGALRTIFSFGIQPSDLGSYPHSGLAVGSDGLLYGTTTQGGDHVGSLFKSDLAGLVTTIRDQPFGGFTFYYTQLTRASDGSFYAGIYDPDSGPDPQYPQSGVVRLKENGAIIFSTPTDRSTDGAEPLAPLIDGGNGYFYGTASVGGANDVGTIFRVSPSGVITSLHSFQGDDGSTPKASLIKGPDGNFYGTTTHGGTDDLGTVFRFTPSGTLTTLISFNGTNGSYPSGGLTLGPDGNLYGTTNLGGANDNGTFYRLTLGGDFTSLANFGDSTGTVPLGGVTLGADGHFYGVTISGGDNAVGTAYRVTTTGVITKLASFGDATIKTASNGVIEGEDGNFYGTGEVGSFDLGAIFRLTPRGDLSIFAPVDKTMGTSLTRIVQDAEGNFFGASRLGGTQSKGRVFKVSPNGEVTVLRSLSSSTGSDATDFIQGDDGDYYGVGVGGLGSVFRVTPSGTVAKLASLGFATTELSSLMQAADGTFYGTAPSTSDDPNGVAFKVTAGGMASILYSFDLNQPDDGVTPVGGLTEGVDGNLYGTTSQFGPTNNGTYFRLTQGGAFTTLAPLGSFGALLRIGDGSFYGTADGIFNATEAGSLNLFGDAGSFSGRGRLLAASDGYIYGTDPQPSRGAIYGTEGVGGGRIFRFTSSPPHLSGLSPSTAAPGAAITLTGKFLAGTSSVSFNGVEAASFRILNASHISAVVPANAASGPVKIVNPLGSAVTTASFTALPALPSPLNISTRAGVLTDQNVLIGGFIITGTRPKKVIIRALGPSLTGHGLQVVLKDPVLELHEPDGNVIVNDNWKDTQKAAIEDTGIPPTNNLESAIIQTVAPGAYTAIVHGKDGGTGVGLVEIYDLDKASDSTVANISTRGFINSGEDVMIGGFIIGGGESNSTVYVRAIGPSLSKAGITDALPNPLLELHDSNGSLVATNDNWKDSPDRADIEAVGLAPVDDLESVIKGTLAPGAYTGVVRGVAGATGLGLVEVYNVR